MDFFGLPVKAKLSGSKVVCEFIEHIDYDVEKELKEHLDEFIILPD